MKFIHIFSILFLFLLSGCIGDDIVLDTVDESIKIMNPIDSIGVGMTYQFEARFLNNIGQAENRAVTWSSSDPEILSIDETGLANGITVGTVEITSSIDIAGKEPISDQITVTVTEEEIVIVESSPERTGTLMTTSTYKFEGSFVLKETDDELLLEFADDLLDAGTGFKIGKLNAYATAYAGYNNRSKGFSDEFRYGIEGGATFWNNRITAIARLIGVKSLKNGTSSEIPNSTSIFANNSEHFSFSPELAYNINDKWGVSAGFGKALTGKIIFANTSYMVGVYYKLK